MLELGESVHWQVFGDDPFEARLSEEARSVLRSLAMRYKTAIVSGRARLTAHGLVQLDELYYAGNTSPASPLHLPCISTVSRAAQRALVRRT